MEELQIKVSQAFYVLNHDTEPSNRAAANRWLVQFQKTDSVWEVASSILTSASNPDFELLFFAAQILKRKIQTEGRVVSLAIKDAIYHSLFIAAKRFSSGYSQLLTQICIALAVLMLQNVDHGKPIDHLFSSLQALQSELGGNVVVLEMLTILPEELVDSSDDDINISSAQRSLYAQEVLSHAPVVFEFLMDESRKSFDDGLQSHERKRKILRCLLSWVRAGCFSEISDSTPNSQQVLNFVFISLEDSSLFNLSIEVLVELVSRHEDFCHVVLCRVPYMQENFLLPAYCDGNDKVMYGLACLMSELGQAAPSLVFKSSLETMALLEALLRCITFPSEEWSIADMTLPFWSALANYISGLETTDRLISDQVKNVFYPMFSTLLETLLKRVQVDDTTYNMKTGDIELPDGLVQFRKNLVETYLDICHLLKPASFIEKLSLGNCMNANAPIPWKEVEAQLFTLNVVVEMVMQEVQASDFSLIMKLVTVLSSTPFEELKGFMGIVHKTLAEVIGSCSKWLSSRHTEFRSLLEFLAAGIVGSQSSCTYASSLRKLCEESNVLFCEPQYLEFLLWIGEVVGKVSLQPDSEEDIVGAIITVFGSVTNTELKNNLILRFLSSSYSAISKITDLSANFMKENPASYAHMLNSAVWGLSSSTSSYCITLLTNARIGTVFRDMKSSPPSTTTDDITLVLLKTLWPLLHKLFRSEHAKNGSLSYAACRALSLAASSTRTHLFTLLPTILDCLSTAFLECQSYYCYIRTAAVLMETFCDKKEYGPLFVNIFERFTKAPGLSGLTSYKCDQDPELIEAYSFFATTFVRSCSKEILATSGTVLEISFENAMQCCPAMHREAALAAMAYLSCFLEVSLASLVGGDCSFGVVAVHIISCCGERLVSNLMGALLGVSPVSRFQAIKCKHEGYVESLKGQWLEALVNASSDYVETTTGDAKAMTMNIGPVHRASGRALKRVLREFAENSRNFVTVK